MQRPKRPTEHHADAARSVPTRENDTTTAPVTVPLQGDEERSDGGGGLRGKLERRKEKAEIIN